MTDDIPEIRKRAMRDGWGCERIIHGLYGDVWWWHRGKEALYTDGTGDPMLELPPEILRRYREKTPLDVLRSIQDAWQGLRRGEYQIDHEYDGRDRYVGLSITDSAGKGVALNSQALAALELAPVHITWLIAEVERLRHLSVVATDDRIDALVRDAVADAVAELQEIEEGDEPVLDDETWGLLEKLVASNVFVALWHSGLFRRHWDDNSLASPPA